MPSENDSPHTQHTFSCHVETPSPFQGLVMMPFLHFLRMRPFYVLLLAGAQPTPSTGFLTKPSVVVSPSVGDGSQRFRSESTSRNLRNRGFRRGQLSGLSPRAVRRTGSSLSVAASSCRKGRARATRTSTTPRCPTGYSAVASGKAGGRGGDASASRSSAVCASHMPTVVHARAPTSEGSMPIAATGSRLPNARIADPTAVAHEYLREFLGMTDEVCYLQMRCRCGFGLFAVWV